MGGGALETLLFGQNFSVMRSRRLLTIVLLQWGWGVGGGCSRDFVESVIYDVAQIRITVKLEIKIRDSQWLSW